MTARIALCAAASALALAACSPPAEPQAAAPTPAPEAPAPLPPVEPREPGTPGGLPDDRTPISEAPFTPQSAQGAANVVQSYFALVGTGRYAEAYPLWSGGGQASGMSQADFVASFDKYSEYHGQIGAPGEIEGAAGSLYVEAPVITYGRLKTGQEVHEKGTVTLRRVNGVDGATPEQLLWRIAKLDLKPAP